MAKFHLLVRKGFISEGERGDSYAVGIVDVVIGPHIHDTAQTTRRDEVTAFWDDNGIVVKVDFSVGLLHNIVDNEVFNLVRTTELTEPEVGHW